MHSSPREDSAEHRIIVLAALTSAIALAYFYVVDDYVFSSRSMSKIFRYLLTTMDSRTAWLSLEVCVAAACWRNAKPAIRLVAFLSSHAIGVAIVSTSVLALGTLFIYHDNAFSMDEYAEVFQAKVFAAGQLTAHLPPSVVDWLIPPGFNGSFLTASRTTGEAIAGFWPGFSLVLGLFEAIGVPWLCNPCLTGLALLLIHRITLDLTGDRHAAGWSILFALASGAFVAYGISYYSMQARLTVSLLFAWLLLKPTPQRSFGAGLVGSVALVVHSPFPHALFAAPWIIWMCVSKQQRRFLAPLIAGYVPLLIVVGVGWLHLRGSISGGRSDFEPVTANITGVLRMPNAPMFDMRAAATVKMWIWMVPGLFLLALLGTVGRDADHRVRLLALSAFATLLGYFFVVFDQGHGWGYRYFHSAWGVVPILAGRAMMTSTRSGGRLAAFAGAAAVLNLLLVVPYQMVQIDRVIARHSAQLGSPTRPGGNVYFIQESGGFYEADLVQMDPLLRAPDLVLFSRGAELDAALRSQNWPTAVLVGHTPSVSQWNIGTGSIRSMTFERELLH